MDNKDNYPSHSLTTSSFNQSPIQKTSEYDSAIQVPNLWSANEDKTDKEEDISHVNLDNREVLRIENDFKLNPSNFMKFRDIISQKFSRTDYDDKFLSQLRVLILQKKINLTFDDLKLACTNGHYQFAEMFLASFSLEEKNIKFHYDSSGKTILHHLALEDLSDCNQEVLKKIVNLLLSNFVDINKKDSKQRSALNYSILKRNLALFKILIDKNINRQDPANMGQACIVSDPNDSEINSMLTTLDMVLRSRASDSDFLTREFLVPLLKSGVLINRVDVSDSKGVKKNNLEIVVGFFNSYQDQDIEFFRAVAKGILSNPLNIVAIAFLANPHAKKEDFKKYFEFGGSLIEILKGIDLSEIRREEIKNMLKEEMIIALEYHSKANHALKRSIFRSELTSLNPSLISDSENKIFIHSQGLVMDSEESDYHLAFRPAIEIFFEENKLSLIFKLMECGYDLNYAFLKNKKGELVAFSKVLENLIIDSIKQNFLSKEINIELKTIIINDIKDSPSRRIFNCEFKIQKLKSIISLINLIDKGFKPFLLDEKFEYEEKKEHSSFGSKSRPARRDVRVRAFDTPQEKQEKDFFSHLFVLTYPEFASFSKSTKIEKLFSEKVFLADFLRSKLTIFFKNSILDGIAYIESLIINDLELKKLTIFSNSDKLEVLKKWLKDYGEGDDEEIKELKKKFIEDYEEIEKRKMETLKKIDREFCFELVFLQKIENPNSACIIEFDKDDLNKKLKEFFLKLKFNDDYFLGPEKSLLVFKFLENDIEYNFEEFIKFLEDDDYLILKNLLFNSTLPPKINEIINTKISGMVNVDGFLADEIVDEVEDLKSKFVDLEIRAKFLYKKYIPGILSFEDQEAMFETQRDDKKVSRIARRKSQNSSQELILVKDELTPTFLPHEYPVKSLKFDADQFLPMSTAEFSEKDRDNSLKSESLQKLFMAINGKEIVEIQKYVNKDQLVIEDLKDFTKGCCFLISFDQELFKTIELQNECKKPETRESYQRFCDEKRFRANFTDLNLFKHCFHQKFNELVRLIDEEEGRDIRDRARIPYIRDSLYFLLALCHASKQKDLLEVKEDIEINYGLGHGSDSTKSQIIKSIFILENLTNIYLSRIDQVDPDKPKILDWIRDLHQQIENEAAEKFKVEYSFKESEIEDSRYLSSLVKELASSKKTSIEPVKKVSKAVHEFCLLYCHFIDEVYQVQKEDYGEVKSILIQNEDLINDLHIFLQKKESEDPDKFFKFLATNKNLLDLFDFMGSSDFIESKDQSLDSLSHLMEILIKFNFKRTNIEDRLDIDSDESYRYKSLIDGFFKNSLVKISDLKKQNAKFLEASLGLDQFVLSGPAIQRRLLVEGIRRNPNEVEGR